MSETQLAMSEMEVLDPNELGTESTPEEPEMESEPEFPLEEAPLPNPNETNGTVLLVYDIPENGGFPNPSGRLHPIGFRLNLSCWAIPISQIPQDLLDEFTEAGINYHIVLFAASEKDKIRAMARKAVAARATEIHTLLIKSLDSATQAFQKAENEIKESCDSDYVAFELIKPLEKQRRGRMKEALKRAAQRLNDAISCAEAFDESMNLDDCLDGLKLAIQARKEAFEMTLTAMMGV